MKDKQQFDIDVYFTIRYYAHKHEKTITRRAKWDSQCKTWNSKKGIPCMTYFDVDASGVFTDEEMSWVMMLITLPKLQKIIESSDDFNSFKAMKKASVH